MSRRNAEITAGDMRHPVQVQRPVEHDDGAGGQIPVWADTVLIYCAIRDKGGSEFYSDTFGRVRNPVTYEFVTWYRADIDVTDRLFYENETYNIRDISNEMTNNKYLIIIAEKNVEQ